MPHSCHQLSALLTAPVARGGLPPATCPLQEEACLHSVDWERPALPLWPLPLTPPLFLSSACFFSTFLFSLCSPLCGSCALTAHPSAALLCGSPGSGDLNQSWFLQAFLKWAQGPWWVSAVAGPDFQLIHREEVTFVLPIDIQFQHSVSAALIKRDSECD